MEKRKIMGLLPPFVFTVIVVGAILWLTLSPNPLPDNDLPMFEGADKIVHGLMFGGLYFAMCFDCILLGIRRRQSVKTVKPPMSLVLALVSVAFGGVIELVQGSMDMGRSCDAVDFVADAAGVLLSVVVSPFVLRRVFAD